MKATEEIDRSRYEDLFLSESREHVIAVNRHLLELERGDAADADGSVGAIFRSLHTIKGMSATMGYSAVAELAHELETLLEGFRGTAAAPAPHLLEQLFHGTDRLEEAIEASVRHEFARVTSPDGVETVPTATARTARREGVRLIRVDLRRLDTLMDVVGELVITRGRLQQIASSTGHEELEESVHEASRLIGELRDEITASRLVPAWQVFDRFPRMVRDTARSLGKEVDFRLEGGDLELDRSMLDEIADSLVHLFRNALDHGLESPEERLAAGKPRVGRLSLVAARERSATVIRVIDDGRGIDRNRVLERARSEGLVDPGKSEISDEELVRVLTRPGFSTAEEVTGISGRGVGIDAVHTRVRSLGGTVDIRTTPGVGTTVALRLPLTLAIVRAVLASVASETYAIPSAHVSEVVELTPDMVCAVQDREMLRLRDDLLPIVRLRQAFGLPEAHGTGSGDEGQGVVLDLGDRRAALIVDDLIGQEEIVVKQFDAARDSGPYFGGATLLADGSAALIVDVTTLA